MTYIILALFGILICSSSIFLVTYGLIQFVKHRKASGLVLFLIGAISSVSIILGSVIAS